MDAESALESWTLDMAAVKPTLSFHQTVDDVYEDEDGEEEEEPEIQNGDVPGQVVEEEEVEWTTEVPVDDEAHEADHHVSQNGHTSGSENI